MRAQVSVCAPSRRELTFSLGHLAGTLPHLSSSIFQFIPCPLSGPPLAHNHTFVSPGQTPPEQRPLSSSKTLRWDLSLFLGHPPQLPKVLRAAHCLPPTPTCLCVYASHWAPHSYADQIESLLRPSTVLHMYANNGMQTHLPCASSQHTLDPT